MDGARTTETSRDLGPNVNWLRDLATWAAALAFLVLFSRPLGTLARDWWSDADAGQGPLLLLLALWLGWRRGLLQDTNPQPRLGLGLLAVATALRCVSDLAAELFTIRFSMVLAAAALVAFGRGHRQVRAWWLPFGLLTLSIPLPAVVLASVSLPLRSRRRDSVRRCYNGGRCPCPFPATSSTFPDARCLLLTRVAGYDP